MSAMRLGMGGLGGLEHKLMSLDNEKFLIAIKLVKMVKISFQAIQNIFCLYFCSSPHMHLFKFVLQVCSLNKRRLN